MNVFLIILLCLIIIIIINEIIIYNKKMKEFEQKKYSSVKNYTDFLPKQEQPKSGFGFGDIINIGLALLL